MESKAIFERLSSELDELGIVDQRMSFYMPLRLRERHRDGYSGFEARYYSLFPSYDRDMAPAANLQQFLLAFAYRLALQGEVTHEEIPDDPTSESERRQPFFFSAAGAARVLRASRLAQSVAAHHPAELQEDPTEPTTSGVLPRFRFETIAGLLAFVQQTGSDLAESMDMQETLADLALRCANRELEASNRLTGRVMGGSAEGAMRVEAREFNRMAEEFYRDGLRREHLREAFSHLREDLATVEKLEGDEWRHRIRHGVRVQDPARFLQDIEPRVPTDDLSLQEVAALLNLLLVLTERDTRRTAEELA